MSTRPTARPHARPRLRRTAALGTLACATLTLGAVVATVEPGESTEPAELSASTSSAATASQENPDIPLPWSELEQPSDTGDGLTPPQEDPFYQPPDPLPDGAPGDIIRAEPTDAFADPLRLQRLDADAWRVMYLSTNAVGEPMAVTGTVLVPAVSHDEPGERPVVTYAVGTRGLADHCAPSHGLATGLDYEVGIMADILARGWALVVSDYEGLGTPGDHTYMVGQSQGRAVLDSLRAATRLDDAGLSDDASMGVTGYSQGGGAAVWAAELAPDYAAELPLAGVAAGGTPADLIAVAENLDGSPFFGFLGAASVGFSAAYADLPLDEHLNEEGRANLDAAREGCLVEILAGGAFRNMEDLTTTDVLGLPEWQQRMAENRAGGTAPEVPLYLYHAPLDPIIPLEQAETLRGEYCAAGAEVRWSEVWVGEHLIALYNEAERVRDWMGDRLAGEPDPGNCPG